MADIYSKGMQKRKQTQIFFTLKIHIGDVTEQLSTAHFGVRKDV